MSKNYNSDLIKALSERAIAFNPVLGKIAGSATAGLFMSQVLYWYGKGRNKEWFYKTIDEFTLETVLSRNEQDRAIAIWKRLGILEIKLLGTPAKRHFKVHEEKLHEVLSEYYDRIDQKQIS